MFSSERRGDHVPRGLVRKVMQSYGMITLSLPVIYVVKLGECVTNGDERPIQPGPSLSVYQKYFEAEYIRFTAEDVRNSCAVVLQQEGFSAFLQAVGDRINSERQRALQYMVPGTEKSLEAAIVVAITSQHDVIASGFRTLLSEGKLDGMCAYSAS